MELKRATLSKGYAQIQVSGEVLSLPGAYQFRKNGKRVAAKAAVKRGGMKPIETGGLKGFITSVRRKNRKKRILEFFRGEAAPDIPSGKPGPIYFQINRDDVSQAGRRNWRKSSGCSVESNQ